LARQLSRVGSYFRTDHRFQLRLYIGLVKVMVVVFLGRDDAGVVAMAGIQHNRID
jgi:hypothetical protein